MSSAAPVPEQPHLGLADLRDTLRRADDRKLVADAVRRLRAADGFSHARSIAFLMFLIFVQAVIALVGLAHAFSAGGPILWPNVDALLFVPLAAHALFARPLVVGPESWFAVEVTERSESEAQVVLDGSRSIDVLRGGRVEVRRGTQPVKLARMSDAPFTERLVRKFSLPINGWRGPVQDG